jgi:pimeloyl-ACP methyl ester carboxylesterase
MILNSIDTGTGECFVLLHGLFGAAKNLGVIARALAGRGRVISLDMRNHGESPHGADMRYETMAGDVVETMAALGVGEATIIGHSMGGKVGMTLALTRPELVARLAVLDIAPVAYSHGHDAFVRAMKAVPLEPGLLRSRADELLAAYVPEAAYRAFLLNNLLLGDGPRWRLGLDEIHGAMADLTGWEEPAGVRPYEGKAIFIRGENSDYVRQSAAPAIARLFPTAGLFTIAGAGHWLHAEKPEAVVAALLGFLDE